MRRRRSSRRSGPKRKLYWTGATFSANQIELANAGFGEVMSAWFKWPSGLQDFGGASATDVNEGFVTASDETLVKTILSTNCTLNLQGVLQDHFLCTGVVGLLTWDASIVSANDVDVVVDPSGIVPNPARDYSADWIIRQPFSFCRDNFSIAPQESIFITSKAMRKLPPRTGILFVFGFEDILASPEESVEWDLQVDCRMLFKSGYYSI